MAEAKSKSGSSKVQATFIKRKKKVKAGTPMTNPPLTPLIDVFLFLIIFFLLGCKFAQFEGNIPANLPDTGPGVGESTTPALEPIWISIRPVGTDRVKVAVTIEGPIGTHKPETMEELYTLLTEYGQSHKVVGADVPKGGKQPIFIHPDFGVQWNFVVDAFNQAVRAGYTEVGMCPTGNRMSDAATSGT